MKALYIVLFALGCAATPSRPVLAQAAAPEPTLAAATALAKTDYLEAFKSHSQLYSGPEYVDYSQAYHVRDGHQFFLTTEKQPGSVYYNNQLFQNIQLQYDIVLGQVVLQQPGSPLLLKIINENVRSFTMAGHRFTRLVADSASGNAIRTGYYEVLVDSTVQVLAKRSKRLQEHLVQPYINAEFTQTDNLFVGKGGQYYAVASKGAIKRLFADRGKEIQRYIQDQKLTFSKARREADLVQLAAYYCSLPPL
jgi:hypothetical protein